MSPKVSIVIPCYNSALYLNTCLASCLNQTCDQIEVVVVNDGSTDDSRGIIESWALQDSRVRLVNKVNEGLVEARRSGISAACGEFIFFLDSDDSIAERAIELLLEQQTKSNADVVVGVIVTLTPKGKVLGYWHSACSPKDSNQSLLMKLLQGKILPSLCGRLIRKEEIASIKIESNLTVGEDFMASLELCSIPGIIFDAIDSPIYNYVQHPGSMINTHNRANANKRMQFIEWVNHFLNNQQIDATEIERSKARFFLDEYYAFLRNDGLPSQYPHIKQLIEHNYLNKRHFTRQVPIWRVVLLKAYRYNYYLGRILMRGFVCVRTFFRN